jgi:hypothetical protein
VIRKEADEEEQVSYLGPNKIPRLEAVIPF